jgi:threonine-phosphate decarboxylase
MAKSGQHGGNTLQMAQQFGLQPDQIIDFSANINPLGMPASLKSAIINNLNLAERYPDIDYQQLHHHLAKHHHCLADQVIAGNGATELIFLWAKQLAPRRALLVEPSFAEYRRALAAINCQIDTFTLSEKDQFCLTETVLEALSPNIDCLILCTPNNPTGRLIDPALLNAILRRCQKLNINVLLDESFIDFIPNSQGAIGYLERFPNLSLLRSVTKFFAIPGIRLGFLMSHDTALLGQIHQQREPWTINAFAALAGEILFADNDYIQHSHQWLAEQQRYLYQALCKFEQLSVYPTSTNYLFFKLNHQPNNLTRLNLQTELMHFGILIRSCANYRGLTEDYYRVAIKSAQDNITLISAMSTILSRG